MTNYKRILNACSLFLMVIVMLLVSCKDEDDGTEVSGVQLYSFGPSVLRGGPMIIIGANLNQVASIVLPDNVEIPSSAFDSLANTMIVLQVPDEVVEGKITLKLTEGEDVVSSTSLSILEPITITNIPTTSIRPGSVITIEGTYLNLIEEVVFATNKSVTEFESITITENLGGTALEVRVPEDAKSGVIQLKDGEEIPNVIKSDVELLVALPSISSMTPLTVKAGNTLTINGADLDLTTMIIFGGDQNVDSADFVSQTATQIEVNVPTNAQDGTISLAVVSASLVSSPEAITLLAPTISSANPTTVGLNDNLTITGSNLDLVTAVTFADGSSVARDSFVGTPTATEIVVAVTSTATDGAYTLNLASGSSITGSALSIILPTIETTGGIVPLTVATSGGAETITITGTRLEDIASATFPGEDGAVWPASVSISSDTQLSIVVTQGSISGPVSLLTTNGETIVSTESLTIVPDVPVVATIDAEVFVGGLLTITGTNLNVLTDIYFPGGIQAVTFASKSATLVEVIVPGNVPEGSAPVTFVNYAKEIFETPDVDFRLAGVEPILAGDLIIMDFDQGNGHGIDNDDWSDHFIDQADITVGNAGPGISDNGYYAEGRDKNVSGWDWLWGCNHAETVKQTNVASADYYLKIDVFIPYANADFLMGFRMDGNDINIAGIATVAAPAWYTVTYDLTELGAPDFINPSGNQTGEWGMYIQGGDYDFKGFKMDNIRFSPK